MRVCIVGAGAIGGFLGARLMAAGADVTLVARGRNLKALQWNGIEVRMADGVRLAVPEIKATARFDECGEQDLVIVAVKAPEVVAVVEPLQALLGPETMVMMTQPGVPWWYFRRLPGPYRDYRIGAADPTGRISAGIDDRRVIGGAVSIRVERTRPGVIRHLEGSSLPVGELDGGSTARVRAVAALLAGAGLRSEVLADIRPALWANALCTLCFDPMAALTHATVSEICQFAPARNLAIQFRDEARAVARALGLAEIADLADPITAGERSEVRGTAMLDDMALGNAPEADALIGTICELGTLTGVATPHLSTAYAMLQTLAGKMQREGTYLRAVSPGPIEWARRPAVPSVVPAAQ